MGRYNPHAPYIIGQEWVPVRQADYAPDKVTEQGYTFHIDHSVVPITGAYYVAQVPQTKVEQVADLVSVYGAGNEALTGPIKQLIIPASAIWVTGTSISSSSGVAALQNPSDGSSIGFTGPSDASSYLGISFDVPSYSQQLFGKRILDVSFLYSLSVFDLSMLEQIGTSVTYAKDFANKSIAMNVFSLQGTTSGPTHVDSFSLSSLNYWWDSTRDIFNVHDIYPWRYQELSRFAATEAAPTRMLLTFFNGITMSQNAFLQYVAMQVTYCEETRILYGGRRMTTAAATSNNYEVGPNIVRLFDTNFASNTTILTPGDYTATLTHDDIPTIGQIGSPKVNALRELYPANPQYGILVNKSLTPDETFTSEQIPVITEITLHTSSAVVTGVHPYGIQDDIPVYGTVTAIQEIEDDPVLTATAFPQVRFYARRFGNTTVPLTLVDVATGLSTASITVADFDALDEIVDGWREVNLRFTVPPSFSVAAGDIDWRWQATNELARNQWQVLGAGSRAFAAHSIGPASYYAPQGNTVTLTWQSPVISGTADDTLSDAVIIFSTDPPTVSGFARAEATQTVATATDNCITTLPCIPTGIYYNRLTWTLPAGIACDEFERTAASSWGNTDTNQAWTIGATPSQWNVASGVGTIQPSTNSADRFSLVTTNTVDNSGLVTFSISALPASGTLLSGIAVRYVDANNHYVAHAHVATTGIISATIRKRVAGVASNVATVATTLTLTPGVNYKLRAQAVGTTIYLKIWLASQDEPLAWTLTAVDTSITTGTQVGLFARNESAVVTQVFSYDSFSIVPFQLLDGRYEIQRMDTVDTDWQTILDTTDLCITGFSDYEARVGVLSTYRIRLCNALDFCGPTWATTSGTLTAPGVVVGGSGSSVLIFTTNESPNSNLAYVMSWEGTAIETFAFPEADTVQLQRMFGKNFFTAFHPLERDGEQFTRTLLVNNAAIALPSLANFTGLRDLAWASLNYVCVRDELGNRWLANIRVPEGTARMDRTVYLAQIQVSEVTDTPTPISVVP